MLIYGFCNRETKRKHLLQISGLLLVSLYIFVDISDMKRISYQGLYDRPKK